MRVCRLCLLCLLNSIAAFGAEADKHVVVVDDHFTLGILNDISISPNGEWIAYTEGRWQESTNDRKSDIWLVAANGGSPRCLTFDRAGYDTLRWSPDGKFLYFACQLKRASETSPPYDGSRQVWRLAVNGTELLPVTRVSDGIDGYDLAANGNWLIYTTSGEEDQGEWAKLRAKFPKIKYGSRKAAQTAINKIDLVNWRTTEITKYSGAVDDFSISPDGMRLAMITAPDGAVITMEGQSKATILDLADGQATDLPHEQWAKHLTSPYGRLSEPRWASDSKALAFAVGFDAYPSEIFVATWDGKPEPQISKVKRPGRVSLHGGVDGGTLLQWRGDSRDLCFLGDDHARVRIYCVKEAHNEKAEPKEITSGDVVIERFVWDRAGKRAAAIYGTPDKMNEVYTFSEHAWKQVTTINAHAHSWALPKISIAKWKSTDGVWIEGILELPADHKPGTPLPMIVNLHGGPTSAWPYNMVSGYMGSVLFASQGYAFFSPNYRGSTGYGDKFITDLIRHENEIEVQDILSGIDKLIEDGIADKDHLAVAGWSNGGYLTNCLIAKTDRFKAASSGAGIIDMTMEWGISDEPAFPSVFTDGAPWNCPDGYRRVSPIYGFCDVKTPTLFHVGENDRRCPKGHSEMAFRALKEFVKVDTELLTYPGEQHGLSSLGSRRAKLAWELAWFDHYLKGRPKP